MHICPLTDPLVDVRIYGGTAQHQLGLRFYGHQTHVCSVQKSAGTPHIQFAGRDYGRYPLQSLYTSAVGRETEQYSNGGLFGITSANHTNITCTVTDALGIYVSETIPSPTCELHLWDIRCFHMISSIYFVKRKANYRTVRYGIISVV